MATRDAEWPAGGPRGLLGRSLIAALVFAAAVIPGWLLAELVEQWTGWVALGYLVSFGYGAGAVGLLAPWGSYRRRDALLGLVPLFGYYLTCVLAWRVALLPYRDWAPRPDELPRARWLDDAGDAGTWLLRAAPLVTTGRPGRPPGRPAARPRGGQR